MERTMKTWTPDELDRIGTADEIEIVPFGGDGMARKPVIIWIVRVRDDLYVRSAYGPKSRWYRGVQARHEGRIRAGGIEKDVAFQDADPKLDREIDAAYRSKYHRHGAQYVDMMLSPEARAATIKLTPC
jgi:hypothetical protein